MRVRKSAASMAVAALSLVVAAGIGEATAPPTTEPAPVTAPGESLPPTETTATSSAWEPFVPGGDCACADGSEYNLWIREADPAKIVFFLEGGGACFDATTCAFTDAGSTTYDWNISPDDDPALMDGIFDFDHPDNPFGDYSFVYVPYCTGDVHLGDLTREYSPELTVEHVGFDNGTAGLWQLAGRFPDAAQVVVVGESAGAVAAPVYGGLVSDFLPDAQVTVYADGSGAYPDDPGLTAGINGLWGSFATMPAWEVNEGLTAEEWSIPRFWVQAGLHDPEIVMSRFDHAYDEVQTAFMAITGSDTTDISAVIDANEAMIEEAGIVQHSFTAPGSDHTLVRDGGFYSMEVGGVGLPNWVSDVVAGDDVADVHCEECGGPAPATTG